MCTLHYVTTANTFGRLHIYLFASAENKVLFEELWPELFIQLTTSHFFNLYQDKSNKGRALDFFLLNGEITTLILRRKRK